MGNLAFLLYELFIVSVKPQKESLSVLKYQVSR